MMTGHRADREEAILDESERAKTAHMAAVIPKPFDIDQLVMVVRNAVGEVLVTSRMRSLAVISGAESSPRRQHRSALTQCVSRSER